MIDVVSFGFGPIGMRLAGRVLDRPTLRLRGVVDADPQKVGKDLGEFLDHPSAGLGQLKVLADASHLPVAGEGAVAIHATSSVMEACVPQFEVLANAGYNIVTTCEQMTFPWTDKENAEKLDRIAQAAGVSILGSGINPGFLMDSLPLVLSAACVSVRSVTVRRTVDTNQRRIPLQKKVGVGMSEQEFRNRAVSGKLGHVGLRQSASLLAHGLGWQLEDYEETLDPIIAENDTDTGLGRVPAGAVLGQRQVAIGRVSQQEVIRYELDMYAGGVTEDSIDLDGDPPIKQVINGGVNGDIGTEAVIANLIPIVSSARPGLLTMIDVLPLRCSGQTHQPRIAERENG